MWPAYAGRNLDRDHEGHWGWRADQILGQLSGWLAGFTPNIALIHLGSNDAFQSQSASSTIGELGQIIDRLRADNPRVKILLARLLPTSTGAAVNARINELNALITGLVSSKNTLSGVALSGVASCNHIFQQSGSLKPAWSCPMACVRHILRPGLSPFPTKSRGCFLTHPREQEEWSGSLSPATWRHKPVEKLLTKPLHRRSIIS